MDKTKKATPVTITIKAYCPHCYRYCKHTSTVSGTWEKLRCHKCGKKRVVRTG